MGVVFSGAELGWVRCWMMNEGVLVAEGLDLRIVYDNCSLIVSSINICI
jgi:hypothetical protein